MSLYRIHETSDKPIETALAEEDQEYWDMLHRRRCTLVKELDTDGVRTELEKVFVQDDEEYLKALQARMAALEA